MPRTPNHGDDVPAEGPRDRHEPLDEGFEQSGTAIEIRDADANRGDYELSDTVENTREGYDEELVREPPAEGDGRAAPADD